MANIQAPHGQPGRYNATPATRSDGDPSGFEFNSKGGVLTAETPLKTSTVIQDWTAVAQNTVAKSSELDLTSKGGMVLHIQAALDTATAHTGTRFVIQTSASASGNEDWVNLTEFVGLIGTANSEAVTNNPLAAGETTITVASTTGYTTLAGMVFIEDATLINSEIVRENGYTTDTNITLLDGATNAHANTAVLYNVCLTQLVSIPAGILRMRVMVDNSYDTDGSTLNYKLMSITY